MTAKQQVIYGIHAVHAALVKRPLTIERCCMKAGVLHGRLQQLSVLARKLGVAVESCERAVLDRLAGGGKHQGVLIWCQPMPVSHDLDTVLDQLTTPPLLLVLDGIQDPHNLGACFRIADAAGVDAIIAPKDRNVGLTPVVSKVASGAVETIPWIRVTNLARTLCQLRERNIWIFGAKEDAATSLFQTDLSGPLAIVLGAEGQGLRRLTAENCDHFIRIPMQGTVASLNVAVAAGVVLFETRRQRLVAGH